MAEVVIRNNNVKVYVTQPSVLESVQVIQGPSGPQGLPGADGVDGANGADGVVQAIIAGSNITVDSTDPANPVVSASGGSAVATTFTPTGSIAATNVQAALAEVDSEKVATSARGVAGGVAELDATGRLVLAQRAAYVGARSFHSVSQSISSATITNLSFDSEVFDSDGLHSTAVNNSRLTVPVGMGGRWLVDGCVELNKIATVGWEGEKRL